MKRHLLTCVVGIVGIGLFCLWIGLFMAAGYALAAYLGLNGRNADALVVGCVVGPPALILVTFALGSFILGVWELRQ